MSADSRGLVVGANVSRNPVEPRDVGAVEGLVQLGLALDGVVDGDEVGLKVSGFVVGLVVGANVSTLPVGPATLVQSKGLHLTELLTAMKYGDEVGLNVSGLTVGLLVGANVSPMPV